MADALLTAVPSLPLAADAHAASPEPPAVDCERFGRIVLVLQGGGALGAYQAGVFQALAEARIAPDWVIGTSVGAINAAAHGREPAGAAARAAHRVLKRHTADRSCRMDGATPFVGAALGTAATVVGGLPGFFEPNPAAWLGANWPPGPEAGYYHCAPLLRILGRLVGVDVLNAGGMRLTVGAANVRTGQMRYFDSRHPSRLCSTTARAAAA